MGLTNHPFILLLICVTRLVCGTHDILLDSIEGLFDDTSPVSLVRHDQTVETFGTGASYELRFTNLDEEWISLDFITKESDFALHTIGFRGPSLCLKNSLICFQAVSGVYAGFVPQVGQDTQTSQLTLVMSPESPLYQEARETFDVLNFVGFVKPPQLTFVAELDSCTILCDADVQLLLNKFGMHIFDIPWRSGLGVGGEAVLSGPFMFEDEPEATEKFQWCFIGDFIVESFVDQQFGTVRNSSQVVKPELYTCFSAPLDGGLSHMAVLPSGKWFHTIGNNIYVTGPNLIESRTTDLTIFTNTSVNLDGGQVLDDDLNDCGNINDVAVVNTVQIFFDWPFSFTPTQTGEGQTIQLQLFLEPNGVWTVNTTLGDIFVVTTPLSTCEDFEFDINGTGTGQDILTIICDADTFGPSDFYIQLDTPFVIEITAFDVCLINIQWVDARELILAESLVYTDKELITLFQNPSRIVKVNDTLYNATTIDDIWLDQNSSTCLNTLNQNLSFVYEKPLDNETSRFLHISFHTEVPHAPEFAALVTFDLLRVNITSNEILSIPPFNAAECILTKTSNSTTATFVCDHDFRLDSEIETDLGERVVFQLQTNLLDFEVCSIQTFLPELIMIQSPFPDPFDNLRLSEQSQSGEACFVADQSYWGVDFFDFPQSYPNEPWNFLLKIPNMESFNPSTQAVIIFVRIANVNGDPSFFSSGPDNSGFFWRDDLHTPCLNQFTGATTKEVFVQCPDPTNLNFTGTNGDPTLDVVPNPRSTGSFPLWEKFALFEEETPYGSLFAFDFCAVQVYFINTQELDGWTPRAEETLPSCGGVGDINGDGEEDLVIAGCRAAVLGPDFETTMPIRLFEELGI